VETRQPNSLSNEYLYGQPLYPAAPLSWLAPLWSFLCGVAASGAWTWTGSGLLRLLLGLLLAGPLLGMAWAASTKTRWRENLTDSPPGDTAANPIPALPYTLPRSASHRLVTWLSAVSAWWQQVKPHLSRPLLHLVVTTIFSLTVAAQLGQQSLVLTAAGLVLAYASGFGRERWGASLLVSVSAPLLLTWLLGHAIYDTLRPASVLIAAFFALTFHGCSALKQAHKGLAWQVAPQAAVVAGLVAIKQPVAATVVALLGTSGALLAPLLQTQPGREQYFRVLQLQLAASMFVAALALGYKQ